MATHQEAQVSKQKRGFIKWLPEEEEALKTEFFEGKSIKEIADSHNRTKRAIEIRLARLATEEVSDEVTLAEAAAKYRVTESMVESQIKKKEKREHKIQNKLPKKATLVSRIEALEEQVRALTEALSNK